MKVEEIKAFKTSDGMIFISGSDAGLHQKALDIGKVGMEAECMNFVFSTSYPILLGIFDAIRSQGRMRFSPFDEKSRAKIVLGPAEDKDCDELLEGIQIAIREADRDSMEVIYKTVFGFKKNKKS